MRLPTFAFSFFFFLLFLLSTLFPFLPSPLPLSPSLSLRPFKEKRNCILYAYINRASLPTRVSDLFFKWKKTKGTKTNLIVRKASQRLSYVCVVCTRVITRLSEVRGLALATLQPSSLPWSREAET